MAGSKSGSSGESLLEFQGLRLRGFSLSAGEGNLVETLRGFAAV